MSKLRKAILVVLLAMNTHGKSETDRFFLIQKDVFGNTLVKIHEWAWLRLENRGLVLNEGFVKLPSEKRDSIMLHINNQIYRYEKSMCKDKKR